MPLRRNGVASSTEPNPPTGNKSGNGVGSSTESESPTNRVNGAGISSVEESSDNDDVEGALAGDGSASGSIVHWSDVPDLDIDEEVPDRGVRQAALRCKEADKRAEEIDNTGEPEYTMIRFVKSDDEWHMFRVLSGKPGHGKWECVEEGHIWGALTTNGMDAKVGARKKP